MDPRLWTLGGLSGSEAKSSGWVVSRTAMLPIPFAIIIFCAAAPGNAVDFRAVLQSFPGGEL